MENKKVAILFYGQPRLLPYNHKPFNNLRKCFDLKTYDVFVHTWETLNSEKTFQFIREFYKPLEMIIEEPRFFKKEEFFHSQTRYGFPGGKWKWTDQHISDFISQIYSVESVCKLIDKSIDKNYDYYILTRFDNLIDTKIDLLSFNFDYTLLMKRDFIQIFNSTSLTTFQSLLKFNKEHSYGNGELDPEIMRFTPFIINSFNFLGSLDFNKDHYSKFSLNFLNEIIIKSKLIRSKPFFFPLVENIEKCDKDVITSQETGMLFEILGKKHIKVLKLSNTKNLFNWIGSNISNTFKIKFNTKDIDTKKIFSKVNDTLIKWDPNKCIKGEWYDIEVPFDEKTMIFVFLDLYEKEIEFEIIY